MTEIIIPSTVTEIGSNAFNGCVSLENVTFPNTNALVTVGDYAFAGCLSLVSVRLPDKVETIGENAFDACSALKDITLPSSLVSIAAQAFYRCTALESVFYRGTTAQWLSVTVDGTGNSLFTSLQVQCLFS